jgi:hypothetical protein
MAVGGGTIRPDAADPFPDAATPDGFQGIRRDLAHPA